MDTATRIVVGTVSVVAVVCVTVLVAIGKGDPVALGVVSTLVLQVLTYITTNVVSKNVNGHMTALINHATTPNSSPTTTLENPTIPETGNDTAH